CRGPPSADPRGTPRRSCTSSSSPSTPSRYAFIRAARCRLGPGADTQADEVSVGREPRLGGGGSGGDIELEQVAVTALPDVGRLLCDGCSERHGGTPKIADGALRLPRLQVHDEDLSFRRSPLQAQERVRF